MFLLYEQITELCNTVMATGAGAFRGMVGTDEGWSEKDAHGSEGDAGAREDNSSGQDDGLAVYFEVFHACFWWPGLTPVKGTVGSTPPAWPSMWGKQVATHTPCTTDPHATLATNQTSTGSTWALMCYLHCQMQSNQ